MTSPADDQAAQLTRLHRRYVQMSEFANAVIEQRDEWKARHASAVSECIDRNGQIAELQNERWALRARVAASEAVQSRMADSLPDQGPWQEWSERDRAVRDYEGELSAALSVEDGPTPAAPEPGYPRIADAIDAACEAADIDLTVVHDGRVLDYVPGVIWLATVLDKAGLIDWAAFQDPVAPALIGTWADPEFVAHQDHRHPVDGCGFCPAEEDR